MNTKHFLQIFIHWCNTRHRVALVNLSCYILKEYCVAMLVYITTLKLSGETCIICREQPNSRFHGRDIFREFVYSPWKNKFLVNSLVFNNFSWIKLFPNHEYYGEDKYRLIRRHPRTSPLRRYRRHREPQSDPSDSGGCNVIFCGYILLIVILYKFWLWSDLSCSCECNGEVSFMRCEACRLVQWLMVGEHPGPWPMLLCLIWNMNNW